MRSIREWSRTVPPSLLLMILALGLVSCGGEDTGTDPQPNNNDGLYDPPEVSATKFTGSLNVARDLHTATLLQDGRVLVTGGFDGTDRLASCELYNPETGAWSLTAPLGVERVFHTATLLQDGRVFVCGGNNRSLRTMNWFELFDPATETWSSINFNDDSSLDFTRMQFGRQHHLATLLDNGRVLITGGFHTELINANNIRGQYLRIYEFYNPDTNTCDWEDEFDRAMLNRRYCHSATLLRSGAVFIAGGFNHEDDYHGHCEIYHPDVDTSFAVTPLSPGRIWHGAHLLADGRVLIAGGTHTLNASTRDCQIYDSSTDTWTATGSMREMRKNVPTVQLPDGRILVAGNVFSKTAEVYDPDTGQWTFVSDMLVTRHLHTMTVFDNGVVLIAGGIDNTAKDRFLPYCELFVPAVPEEPEPPTSGDGQL